MSRIYQSLDDMEKAMNTDFQGITYDAKLDGPRLTSQLFRTKKLMADGKWRSLPAIAKVVGLSLIHI